MYFWKQNNCRTQKKTSVSYGFTESAIISLDAGLRMDGLLALDLWDMVIEMLRSTNNNAQPTQTSHQETGAVLDSKTKTQHVKRKQKDEQLSEVDYVPTNTHSSQGESQLYIFEDNEAVIKMIIKGRSPTMRRVSRTHRVALDWLFDRINSEPKNPNQIHRHQKPTRRHTDQGNFTHDEWNHLLTLFNISHFSSTRSFSLSQRSHVQDQKSCTRQSENNKECAEDTCAL